MLPHGTILVYGHDLDLLHTRRLVLQHAGFNVEIVTSLKEAETITVAQSANLFILCHSLSARECENALKLAHSPQMKMKSLVLTTGKPVPTAEKDDELLNSFDGPTALVATVTKLLQTAAADRNSSLDQSLV
jgi:DNA-binding NtrC family response regulator